jgi:hypothetical protein
MSRLSVVFGVGCGPESPEIDLRHVAFEQFRAAIQASID